MRPTWDEVWMDVARTVALRSLCDRDQVGAVIVSATNRLIDTGYNGPPAGFVVNPSVTCTHWCARAQGSKLMTDDEMKLEGSYNDCPALHAEANALMFSDRRIREGGTIYVSSGTCGACAKLVANSGLKRAVYVSTPGAAHRDSDKWYDFMHDCGLEIVVLVP